MVVVVVKVDVVVDSWLVAVWWVVIIDGCGWSSLTVVVGGDMVVVVVRIQLACDEFSHSVNLDLETFKILQTFFLQKFTPIKVIIYSSHLSL